MYPTRVVYRLVEKRAGKRHVINAGISVLGAVSISFVYFGTQSDCGNWFRKKYAQCRAGYGRRPKPIRLDALQVRHLIDKGERCDCVRRYKTQWTDAE